TVSNRVAGVLVAAGEGKRLGTPKALVELGGRRLVDRGADLLRDGGTAPVLVVTGAAPVTVPGAILVPNPDWRTGMGSSLTAGLRALPGECTAAVIALVDQPLIGADAVRRLISAYQAGAELVVAAYHGRGLALSAAALTGTSTLSAPPSCLLTSTLEAAATAAGHAVMAGAISAEVAALTE